MRRLPARRASRAPRPAHQIDDPLTRVRSRPPNRAASGGEHTAFVSESTCFCTQTGWRFVAAKTARPMRGLRRRIHKQDRFARSPLP
ncbi:hypothetical protein AQ611_07800 [Burkholderia singularis]|nr:hypothetical protein AQ611_07800 [Burkholderia sp. Bp7605]